MGRGKLRGLRFQGLEADIEKLLLFKMGFESLVGEALGQFVFIFLDKVVEGGKFGLQILRFLV